MWRRPVSIDAEFYKLGLPDAAERVYCYLCARCGTRWHVAEEEIVSTLRIEVKRVRAAIEMLVDAHMVKRWKFPRPKCTEYVVTPSTEKLWGIGGRRSYSIGSRRSLSWGAGAPVAGEQALPPPITINPFPDPDPDTSLIAVFKKHFTKWTFNRKAIGSKFHFNRKMESQAMECMRWLNGQPGMCTTEAFDSFLSDAGEYLSLPRDVVNAPKDFRALAPGRWLSDWAEQVRLAGIYHDEKRKNVVRIESAE
tara:strand:+ start:353 stop:1105 length:753 start_codon:yes stop_codon:yes gene_type:complete